MRLDYYCELDVDLINCMNMGSPTDASDAEEGEFLGERYLTKDGKIRLVLLTKSSRWSLGRQNT